jgi:hypothetical protein
MLMPLLENFSEPILQYHIPWSLTAAVKPIVNLPFGQREGRLR